MKTLVLCLLALAPSLSYAELDCVVPTREEGFEAGRPGAEALRRAARAAAAITQKNAVFMAGNKPVRVRTSISYYGLDWLSASVITTAYNQKAWLRDGCQISPNADRGGGLADGQIAIFINDPGALFGGQLGDGELRASFAPVPRGSIAGFPVYLAGGNDQNPRVLLSEGGYRPWVPVAVAEMLDWQERELVRRETDYARGRQASNALDERRIDEIYRGMKRVDPDAAEKTRTNLLASQEKMRASAAKNEAAAKQAITKRRAAFDAYRASLTPEQLAAPGTMSTVTTREGAIRADDPAGKPLAKVDPTFSRRDPKRLHAIVVSVAPQPKSDPEYAWQQASYE
ncbi:MAG: hypothetical protein ACREBN_01050, partial [Burkholderiaceae bacterium]